MKEFTKLPPAESVRRIDFETAEVFPFSTSGQPVLVVKGMKPYKNMRVELYPMIYINPPEYWEIEVVGILPGIWLPAEEPYSEGLHLSGTVGTKGIEVVGATRRKRIEVTA